MDKIAIISDIHGNLEALKTALNDIKSRKIDNIYCLGDIIAKGYHSQECIDLIRKNCKVVVKGNYEEYVSDGYDLSKKSEEYIKMINWNKSRLNNDTIKYLNDLPFCHELYISGRLVRLIHAHPTRTDKCIASIDKIENLYELVLPSDNTVSNIKADILVCGHMHTPYMQKIYNRYILNTGSVGNAIDIFRNDEKDGDFRNTTVINYLIIYGNLNSHNNNEPISFEFVSIPYDIDKELLSNKDNIDSKSYAEELKYGKYRNMDRVYQRLEERGVSKDDL